MKTIKINYIGWTWSGVYNEHNNYITDILARRYNVEISDDPEWIFCTEMGEAGAYFHYTKYDCPRIFICGENLTPDFSIVDYAISHNRMDFEDRHFYYPSCMYSQHYHRRYIGENLGGVSVNNAKNMLNEKDIFCNFIYGHESEKQIRESFFKELSDKYKPVTSAGKYLNNMPDGKSIPFNDKIAFQKKCKFTIAFESTRHSGFCTEKILDAFYANTIPIYYGNPHVTEIFNPEAFINVQDYKSYDDVIEEIKRLDNDIEAYIKMLTVYPYNDPEFPEKRYREFCEFLYHIFDQEPEQAFRRSRVYRSKSHNDILRNFSLIMSGFISRNLFRIICLIKKGGIKALFKQFRQR